jgi:hypothetical protein
MICETLPWKDDRYILEGSERWKVYDSGGQLVRQFELKGTTPNSFFFKIEILGYSNGSIRIDAHVSEKCTKAAEAFFQNHKYVSLSSLPLPFLCVQARHAEARAWFFSKIKKNIEANDYLDLMEKISQANDWKGVTPPTWEEDGVLRNLRYYKIYWY